MFWKGDGIILRGGGGMLRKEGDLMGDDVVGSCRSIWSDVWNRVG